MALSWLVWLLLVPSTLASRMAFKSRDELRAAVIAWQRDEGIFGEAWQGIRVATAELECHHHQLCTFIGFHCSPKSLLAGVH